jgi:hypothetical protein
MNDTSLGVARTLDEQVLPFAFLLELNVADPELIRELVAHPEGKLRDEYALCALRIGLLALKQARGQVDGETIKREGERLLGALEGRLSQHARGLDEQITGVLKDYFDPESGRMQERIQRLVKKDGELEELLRRQIGMQDSELCKTLSSHFGIDSPLMKLLSPTESEGLLKALRESLAEALTDQRQRVLGEFSLDNEDGSLSRLVKKLTDNHGAVNKDLQRRIDEVVKEFSLDAEDSALSRLVRRVTTAQQTISAEFSLDNENSALSRMSKQLRTASEAINLHLTLDNDTSALSRLRRELLELLSKHSEANLCFQEEVKRTLEAMRIRREEAQRSTLHGKEFERIVFDFIHGECQRVGEVAEFTGDMVGTIKNCKIGDTVIEMGPDHAAAGARVVIEAKDKAGFLLRKAREEIDSARKNRQACIGIFVFAKGTAPEGMAPFQRFGDDLFVVWDQNDPQSDLYLQAALMVSRALCTRKAKERAGCAADFAGIDVAILDIEKKADSLDEVRTSAESIKNGADKILNRVRLAREGIGNQIIELRELMADLKTTVQAPDAPGA